MIEINTIPAEAYHQLAPVFDAEFDSGVPDSRHAVITGAFDGNVLAGFINAESLVWIGQIYIAPAYQGNGIARKLITHVESRIPEGASVITIASHPRYEKLYERKGMFRIPGTIWRKDF